MKYRESQFHPFLCYWDSLLNHATPIELKDAKEGGIAREFVCSDYTGRGNIVKLCADSLNSEGTQVFSLIPTFCYLLSKLFFFCFTRDIYF